MLKIEESNLLSNREGLGATNTYEWVADEYRGSGASGRLVVGDSADGGAAHVDWTPPGLSAGALGFRVAVVLGS